MNHSEETLALSELKSTDTNTPSSNIIDKIVETSTSVPHPVPRSTKRAHSNASISERNKFRSKLDNYSLTSTVITSSSSATSSRVGNNSSGNTHNNNNGIVNSNDEVLDMINPLLEPRSSTSSNYNNKGDKRHYSASSVTHQSKMVSLAALEKSVISPMDPSVEPLWNTNTINLSSIPLKLISNEQFKSLINWHYKNQLPDCENLFPWLHGIHHSNIVQRDFLNSLSSLTTLERDNFDETFTNNNCLIPSNQRYLMPVRSRQFISTDENKEYLPNSGIIKGSVSPSEILSPLIINKESLLMLVTNLIKEIRIVEENSREFHSLVDLIFNDCYKLKLVPCFKDLDPIRGVSLRNFHIQVSKIAQISDFVVYCFNKDHLNGKEKNCQCMSISRLLYLAQLKHSISHPELLNSIYQTIILQDCDINYFKKPKNNHLLAIDLVPENQTARNFGKFCSNFDLASFNNWDSNYLYREKLEISKMSTATLSINNVWMGNTTDFEVLKLKKAIDINPLNFNNSVLPLYIDPNLSTMTLNSSKLTADDDELLITPAKVDWKIFINCSEGSNFPTLTKISEFLNYETSKESKIELSFPPSGSITIGDCSDSDILSIINTCKLLYLKSSTSSPSLVYCSDGYTESSFLNVCYLIYSTFKKIDEVLIDLHSRYGRPFFLFPTDVQLITKIQELLLFCSPLNKNYKLVKNELDILPSSTLQAYLFKPVQPSWCLDVNGSLPSRLLSYLYLGSLTHASSSELLKHLKIKRIICVGEKLTWLSNLSSSQFDKVIVNNNIAVYKNFRNMKDFHSVEQVMCISNIQDDGIDALTHNLKDILTYLEDCYTTNSSVLVHCRVGVSRSATVCIAEVMKRLRINLIKAYIYVRVRRLNVIIQPNLRFMYELVKWEEYVRMTGIRANSNSILMDSDFDDEEEEEYYDNVSIFRNNKLMNSITSTLSDEESKAPAGFPRPESPVRLHTGSGQSASENNWLRDVDWHVLCREIDSLNKAYIKAR